MSLPPKSKPLPSKSLTQILTFSWTFEIRYFQSHGVHGGGGKLQPHQKKPCLFHTQLIHIPCAPLNYAHDKKRLIKQRKWLPKVKTLVHSNNIMTQDPHFGLSFHTFWFPNLNCKTFGYSCLNNFSPLFFF